MTGITDRGLPIRVWRLHTASWPRVAVSLASLAALVRAYIFAYRHFTGQAFFDFWSWVADFQRWTEGRFTLHDLVKPHLGQHRIVTTRLLLLLDSIWFDMQGHSVAIINLMLLAGLGLLLWRLVRLDGVAGTSWDLPPLFWIALASAVCQVENIIFPFQVQFALTAIASVAAISLLTAAADTTVVKPTKAAWLAGGAGLCAVTAAFSMASGVVLAPALFGLLALRRAQWLAWAVFAPICLIGLALFFYHFPHVHTLSPFDRNLALDRLIFVGNFTGSALTAFPRSAAITGLCAIALFLVAAAALLNRFAVRGAALPAGDAALAALGIFVMLCGSAATLTTRMYFGPQGALASRYATMSLLFVAVLIGLYARWGARTRPPAWIGQTLLPTAGLLILTVNNIPWYDQAAAGWNSVVRADSQFLVNDIGILGPGPDIDFEDVRPWVAFLHARRLNMFAPGNGPPATLLARLRGTDPARLPRCRGFTDLAYAIDTNAVLVTGWVTDPAGRHALPWIAALDAQGTLLGTAPPLADRPDLDVALGVQHLRGFEDGFRLIGPSTPDAVRQIRIIGLEPGSASPLCTLPPLSIGPVLIEPVSELRGLTPLPLASPAEASGFKAQLSGPAEAPPAGAKAWYLATGDAHGTLRFRITSLAGGQNLAIPFAMAGSGPRRLMTVIFADGTRVEATLPSLWSRPAWRAAVVPAALMARHTGPVTIDVGAAGDEWLAIGTPLSATLRPDWSRLY